MTATRTDRRSRIAGKSNAKSVQVSPLVRKAIELMVWQGHHRDDAAKALGMLPKSLYNAFRKHHVRQHYRNELEVLRTSERARNIHALVRVRDQDDNKMAAVQAVKALEQLSDEPAAAASSPAASPGLVLVIAQPEAMARVVPLPDTVEAAARRMVSGSAPAIINSAPAKAPRGAP